MSPSSKRIQTEETWDWGDASQLESAYHETQCYIGHGGTYL